MRTKKLNEAVEKAKIRNLTQQQMKMLSGTALPSGKPGKEAICDDIELTIVSDYTDNTIIHVMIQDYDDRYKFMYAKEFSNESDALKLFDSIAQELTDIASVDKIAKKYGFDIHFSKINMR